MKTQIEIAERIAREAHAGQYRHDGITPYVTHPEEVARRLAANGECEEVVATAWLHDVLEDCKGWTWQRMEQEGISPKVTGAVLALTRNRDADYELYVIALGPNEIARRVKIQDIIHNLGSRPNPKSIRKYLNTLDYLLGL